MPSISSVAGRSNVRRRTALLVAAPLALVAAGCSSNGSSGNNTANTAPTSAPPVVTTPPPTTANQACAPVTAKTSAKPPANVPVPSDATFYSSAKAGSTTQYFAYAPGSDVKKRRDAIKAQLSQAGYEIKGTDAEDNEEAELEFEGKGHDESTIQVIHREGCESQLRVRYQFSA